MVYDNIDSRTGEIQTNWIFTYNQGTFIEAAVELHKILGEKSYLNDAMLAADHTTSTLVNNSVLKSEGEGDGGLFKGIFIRYFTDLIQQERLDAAAKKTIYPVYAVQCGSAVGRRHKQVIHFI